MSEEADGEPYFVPAAIEELRPLSSGEQRLLLGAARAIGRNPELGDPLLSSPAGDGVRLPFSRLVVDRERWTLTYFSQGGGGPVILAFTPTSGISQRECLEEAVERWAALGDSDPRRESLAAVINLAAGSEVIRVTSDPARDTAPDLTRLSRRQRGQLDADKD